MNTYEVVKKEFYSRDISFSDAIWRLEEIGYSSLGAEEEVERWENDRQTSSQVR